MHGDAPIYERLQEARERAEAAGATNIEVRPIIGGPVHVLLDLTEEVQADLLVVGNLGMTIIGGRLLGSVRPASPTTPRPTSSSCTPGTDRLSPGAVGPAVGVPE